MLREYLEREKTKQSQRELTELIVIHDVTGRFSCYARNLYPQLYLGINWRFQVAYISGIQLDDFLCIMKQASAHIYHVTYFVCVCVGVCDENT